MSYDPRDDWDSTVEFLASLVPWLILAGVAFIVIAMAIMR